MLPPVDMLGGLAKSQHVGFKTWGFVESLLVLPLDMLWGLVQSQPKSRPTLRTPSLNKYEASRRHEHDWSPRPEP
jgi:hypothetical protein